MTAVLVLLAVAGALAALPGVVVALHYAVLALASLAYRERRAAHPARVRFLVLVPAHDEEAVIGATLDAIARTLRPGDDVLLVDDRSTDRTGEIARARGVRVLRRDDDREPGRAAARQDGITLALAMPGWDALACVDADSLVPPGYLDGLEAVLGGGADAVQARSEGLPAPGIVSQATLAAFALQGIVVPRGRDRLGLSVRLKGTGLAVRRWLVERHRFRGPGAGEDLWFSNDLLLDGVVARHVDSIRLRSASAATVRSAAVQRVRWEAARLMAAREYLPPLLRRRDPASLEAALHLATPPLGPAVLGLVVGAALLAVGDRPLAVVPAAALAVLAAVLCLGLVQARAPLATWLALAAAPAYVLLKAWVQLRAVATVVRGSRSFPATPRS